jgi:hypothetical protein
VTIADIRLGFEAKQRGSDGSPLRSGMRLQLGRSNCRFTHWSVMSEIGCFLTVSFWQASGGRNWLEEAHERCTAGKLPERRRNPQQAAPTIANTVGTVLASPIDVLLMRITLEIFASFPLSAEIRAQPLQTLL